MGHPTENHSLQGGGTVFSAHSDPISVLRVDIFQEPVYERRNIFVANSPATNWCYFFGNIFGVRLIEEELIDLTRITEVSKRWPLQDTAARTFGLKLLRL